jgi:hypothetical protein
MSTTAIGSIEIQMLADLARLRADMNDAKTVVGNATQEMQRMADFAGKALGAIGVGFSLNAFKNMVTGFIDAAEALHDLSLQTGATVESLSAMQEIGRLTGTSAETIGGAMNKLAKNMSVANEESKGTAQAIKALGLDFNTFKALRPEDQMVVLAQAMNKFEDGGNKSALAMTLLGKQGAAMLPFMKDLATSGKLVATVTTEQAAAADEYNDAVERSRLRIEAYERALAMALLPALLDLQALVSANGKLIGEYLTGSAKDASDSFDGMGFSIRVFGTVLETLIVLASEVAFVFKSAGREIGGIVAQFQALGEGGGIFTAEGRAGWTNVGKMISDDAVTARAELDKFQASILGTTDRILQSRDALKNHSLSSAENNAEMQRLAGRYGAAKKEVLDFHSGTDAAAKAAEDARKKREADELKGVQDIAKARSDARKKEEDDILKWELSEVERRNKEVKAAGDAVKAAQDEYDNQGKLRSQIAEVTLTRLVDKQNAFTAGSANYDSVQKEIDAQRELIGILKKGEARDASTQAAKDAADAWKQTTDDIGRGLTDSLFRAFESGKDFFSTFWSGIKNTFKTTVLKIAMQGTDGKSGINGFINKAGSTLLGGLSSGFTGTASASTGGGIMGTIGSLGSMAGGFAGDVVGSMMGAGTASGGMMGSAAGALGTAMPFIGAALALYALYKKFKHVATPHMGSVVTLGADGRAVTGGVADGSQILNNYSAETDKALRALGGASAGALNSLSTAFGGAGGFGGEFKFAADGKDASIGSAILSRNGADLGGSVGGRSAWAYYSKDREEAFAAYTADVAGATRAALDAVALPKWAREQFEKLGSASTIEEFAALADAVAATQAALRSLQTEVSPLGGVFARVAGLSGDALKQLTDFAGGIEAFGVKVGGYVKSYYSESEQAALGASSLTRALSAAGIDAGALTDRASFRALVDSTDVGSQAGRQQLAALLNVAESFAPLADYLAKEGGTLAELAALAPAIGALGDLNADAQTATANGLATLDASVLTSGQNVVDAILALQASTEAGFAAVAANTAATTRQLNSWDDGGALNVVNQDNG